MGGKRLRIDTNFQLKKCAKKRVVGNYDRISQLPDDILIDILSFLSINEAARTSVLSSRWINLWKHTPSLNFDALNALTNKIQESSDWRKLLKTERRNYRRWVNSVLRSHKSTTLKEFIICFDLNNSYKSSIARWLDFAFARQVQTLELDLNTYSNCLFSGEFLYDRRSVGAPKSMVVGFKSLKSLTLRYIDMTGGDIECILQNCPLLEQLVVHGAQRMSNLVVCGSSLVLKHLEIVNCEDFISLKVSAPRLTSLTVKMFEELLLEHVPMLTEVSLRCDSCSISIKRVFSQLSCCISQLKVLCLELICLQYSIELPIELCEFPEMPKLNKLVIKCCATGDESLVRLTAFMRAFPYLEEFVLKYEWDSLPREDKVMKNAIIRSPHNHLKVFKFCGYYGRTIDAELLSYILGNCVVLEKIIIDSSGAISPDTDGLDVEQTARKNANEHLEPHVPHHIQLVIL
ncbi:hypothetical protein ABFX02_10G017100 [Erythranthe guttata]